MSTGSRADGENRSKGGNRRGPGDHNGGAASEGHVQRTASGKSVGGKNSVSKASGNKTSGGKNGGGKPGGRRPSLKPGLPARSAAAAIIDAVLGGHSLDAALDPVDGASALAVLPERDRALARAIVGVSLRRLGQIEDALGRLVTRPLPAKARAVHAILVISAAQLLFLDVPDHAAVSLAVDLAHADRHTEHYATFVNGVMRALARGRAEILAAQDAPRLNTPSWLYERWSAAYGVEAAGRIAEAHMGEAALDLTVKSDPQGWAERLGGTVLPTGSVRLTPRGQIERLDGYLDGAWWVQDAAAALPARLLGDVAGKRVADLCAAPGGKTAELAVAGARVTAVDISPARLERLASNLARLGLHAEIVVADLAEWQPEAPFDAVLLDAPCSATGTIRRHPDVVRLKGPADIAALAALQASLLRRAAGWVALGGTLVYCTCSLEPEEGEQQIARFLAEGAPFRRVPVRADEIGGLAECLTADGDLRTLPFHLPATDDRRGGLDGFFAARLVRVED
ncbi:16S rRNA (cytosine967-C5)-methyltransferase [Pseudoxanthobacter soli DSM 19599]|uniref:16S rRNA (Cytosine967-C5)-methyltransferase n=1 Tax=Pseudoxanthobacter soli DSM 19599 TaxID=1123029 RepID=A0A1M7ZM55_9HYPH|nr:16S rRNA (cytosine967-C5)-methyltransferase [Pseudoxanthobacter soli DSM 19599]